MRGPTTGALAVVILLPALTGCGSTEPPKVAEASPSSTPDATPTQSLAAVPPGPIDTRPEGVGVLQECSGQRRVRPLEFSIGGCGSGYVTINESRYTEWESTRAVARAVLDVHGALTSDPHGLYPVTVIYDRPERIDGLGHQYYFTRLQYTFTGKSRPRDYRTTETLDLHGFIDDAINALARQEASPQPCATDESGVSDCAPY